MRSTHLIIMLLRWAWPFAKESIEEDPNSESTKNKIKEAISSLDKASQKGVLHKNNAARRKSRLIKKLSSGTKK